MQVRDIMSAPAISVPPTATLEDVVETMLEHRIGSVLVIDTGIQGIVTRSDVLRAVAAENQHLDALEVTTAMSPDVVTTAPTISVTVALDTMEVHSIKKLPVVADFDVVGIVTMTDIAQHQPERVQEARGAMERKDEWTG